MPAVATLGEAVSDLELVEALAADAAGAVEHLYARYGRLAYSTALAVVRDPARAEDVVQDSFVKLWRSSAAFDAERGTLRTWLLTTVRRRSVDYLRGRHAHERGERELPGDAEASGFGADPWRHVASLIDRTALQEALASLPAEQRQAIELAYFEGYRHPEIARLQGVPLSTVKGRVRLAIKKLHLYLRARGLVFDAAHEELQELIAPFLLGACEHGEQEVMEAHLELCESCRRVATELAEAVVLAAAAPAAMPSTGLRERILQAARERSPKLRRRKDRFPQPRRGEPPIH